MNRADSLTIHRVESLTSDGIFLGGNNRTLADIWDQLHKDPNFHENASIAPDGGFSHVKKLGRRACASGEVSAPRPVLRARYFMAASSLIMCIFNVAFVYLRNNAVLFEETWCEEREGSFLFTNRILQAFGIKFTWSFAGANFRTCEFGVKPLVFVGMIELMMLGTFLLTTFWLILNSSLHCDRVNRWHSVRHLFWKVLPHLRSFSALWALHFITPAIMATAASETVSQLAQTKRPYALVFRFLALRVFCGLIGVDAFLVKVRDVKTAARLICSRNPERECNGVVDEEDCIRHLARLCWVEFYWDLLTLLVFLNQVLGIVQVAWFVHHRLNVFIFGGEKATVNHRDLAKMRTYHAMLAQAIWRESTWAQFLAIMLSWTDYDLQALFWNHCSLDSQEQVMPQSDQGSKISATSFTSPGRSLEELSLAARSICPFEGEISSGAIQEPSPSCSGLADIIIEAARHAVDEEPSNRGFSWRGSCAGIPEGGAACCTGFFDDDRPLESLGQPLHHRLSISTV